ncbi:vWA domain-containing protein [Salibaculum halophilum]|uniref:vWA domain-containing protein n=1 Tax=Salibaculum halophilum TaxID=1914408 RepID=UPI000A115ADE|nr:VWA domain-containing protein [Salibaculum halophilum]
MKPIADLVRLTAAVTLAATPAAAQESGAPSTMLILDGSGSMWGQIDGQAKIGIARGSIDRMLSDWPEDRALGLMAYGHRREGDCDDIEVLAAPAPLDRDTLGSLMDGISPRGKTPIGAAVRAARDSLGANDAGASVVVVTDGLENCGADLCALGDELAQSGTPLTAHVIGFDVADADGQLACLAEATGGQYLSANNAAGLTDALQTVSQPAPDPAGPLYVDDFDRAELGSDWAVQQPDPNGFILDKGALMTMTVANGYLGKPDQPNVFSWTAAELPGGDWEIAADFTARMGEVKTLGGRRAILQVGRYADPDNYVVAEVYRQGNSNDDMWLKLLAVTGGDETSDGLEIASDSCCPRDYDLGRILSDFEEKGATLSLVKSGRDYRARLEMNGWSMQPDGPEVLETEPVTVLRTQGPPAIFAGTMGPEQTVAEFDRVEITEVQ